MTSSNTSIAQRSTSKLYFDHKDMDYYLAWIMGRQIYDGSDAAECRAAAAQIADGDAASWQRAWAALADALNSQADRAVAAGDAEGARRAYLRTCTYYRASLFIMDPKDAAFRTGVATMQAAFRQAAARFDPPIEPIQVPFQGRTLTGYFWKVDDSGQPRPTLLVAGGIETFAEDCYFMIGPSGPQRGYNVLTVDLPGQGLSPDQGLHFGAQMEKPAQAAVDYALSRPEVDSARLAFFGFSWGGHIAFKAGQHDRRIAALIANPPMPDVFRAVLAQQKGHDRSDPIARIVFAQIAWRMGLKISLHPGDIGRRIAKAYDYLTHGKADVRKIDCPVLLLAGEGEAPITLQIARETYDQLSNPKKKLVIFTRQEGGEAHCQVDNLALPNGVIFDWLDAVL